MTRYYEGTFEVLENVRRMNEADLYHQLDALYGRGNLPSSPSIEQLRREALRQTKLDCTIPMTESQKYDVEFYRAVVNALK